MLKYQYLFKFWRGQPSAPVFDAATFASGPEPGWVEHALDVSAEDFDGVIRRRHFFGAKKILRCWIILFDLEERTNFVKKI